MERGVATDSRSRGVGITSGPGISRAYNFVASVIKKVHARSAGDPKIESSVAGDCCSRLLQTDRF